MQIECESCGGTGLYCGFAEPKGVAVVCLECDGTGATKGKPSNFTKPFKKRKRRSGIKTVRLSCGTFLATGVGPAGGSVTYEEFWDGKMPGLQ